MLEIPAAMNDFFTCLIDLGTLVRFTTGFGHIENSDVLGRDN